MSVSMIGPKFYAWDNDGKPLAFGKVYTYKARTNAPKDTYQSEDGVVANTNPVILNGEGYANIYLDGSYKIVVKDADNNERWTTDPVTAQGGEEWVNCVSASYLSGSSFKVVGNVTDRYTVGRALRIDNNTAEYSHSFIKSSVFAGEETTITAQGAVITTGVRGVCSAISGPLSNGESAKTIADAKALDLAVGATIDTQGYHAVNDGGGASYVVVAGGTGVDDGGSYHDMTNGNQLELIVRGTAFLKWFGAVEDRLIDASAPIQAALNYAKMCSNITVDFNGVIFRKSDITASLVLQNASGITLTNGGILHDDTDINPRRDLINIDDCKDITLKKFSILGTVYTYPSEVNQSQALVGRRIENLLLDNVTIKGVRFMSTAFTEIQGGQVVNCVIEDSLRDGIRFTNSNEILISNNRLKRVSDDAIAFHSIDGASRANSGVIITGNTLVACQGIKCLGAKRVVISNNTLHLNLRSPIVVAFDTTFVGEGSTPSLAVSITGNVITDTLMDYGTNYSIIIKALQGMNTTTGVGVGVDAPTYAINYLTDLTQTDANNGIGSLIIRGNIIKRTVEPALFSSYGYGELLDRASIDVFSDPVIVEDDFKGHGIQLTGPLYDTSISNNILSGIGIGFTAILFQNTHTPDVRANNNIYIKDNLIVDCPGRGVAVTGQIADITILNNLFDLDPFFRSPSHNVDNTWSSSGDVIAIDIGDKVNAVTGGNRIKNAGSIGILERTTSISPNIIYSDFVGSGNNAGNKGVRRLPNMGGVLVVPIDGDPNSNSYGRVLNVPEKYAQSMPTSGRYVYSHLVNAASVNIVGSYSVSGWWRLTTGDGHVEGVDWLTLKSYKN